MVGCDSSAIMASSHCLSPAQCSTPSCCFMVASLRRAATASTIFTCAGVSGLALSKKPVTVGVDQRVQGLHQVPRRAVHGCFQAGVDVVLGPASPLFAGGNQLQFDDAFSAKIDLDVAIGFLSGRRHEDAHG